MKTVAKVPFVMSRAELRRFLGSLETPQLDSAILDEAVREEMEAEREDYDLRGCEGLWQRRNADSDGFCTECRWNKAGHAGEDEDEDDYCSACGRSCDC